jgi:hypothetical protein
MKDFGKKAVKWVAISVIAISAFYYLNFANQETKDSLIILVAFYVFLFWVYKLIKLNDLRHEELKKQIKKEFKCVLRKPISVEDTKEQYNWLDLDLENNTFLNIDVTVEVTLPFPPFPELSISEPYIELPIVNKVGDGDFALCPDDKFSSYGFFATVKKVHWKWKYGVQHFVCEVLPHKMSKENILGAVLINHIEHGWTVEKKDAALEAIKDFIQKRTDEIKSGDSKSEEVDELNWTRKMLFSLGYLDNY